MTSAAADSPSSSFSSQFIYPTSSSSSTQIVSIPDSGLDKSLKRKRSSPHYPKSSAPDWTNVVVVKTEEHSQQQQERDLLQTPQQKPPSPNKSLGKSARPPLHNHHNASNNLFPQTSSASCSETSYGKSTSLITSTGQPSFNSKEQGTQTGLELPVREAYLDWDGRGRSPFKTPAFAAIDSLKKGAGVIERLEREAAKERKELVKLIQWKINLVTGLKRTRLEIVQDRMDPLKNIQVFAQPDIDDYRGRSKSPNKYICKMKYSTPSVDYQRFESFEHTLPEPMETLLGLLEGDLGAGSIPLVYEVVQAMILH